MIQPRPTLAIITMGGTIVMAGNDGDGVKPVLTAEDLVATVPQLAARATLRPLTLRNQPSNSLGLSDVDDLAAEIFRQAESGADGVVITHGTDTIEETAFALDLMVRPPIPVVMTGAMRNPTLVGGDGPLNVYHAGLVACMSGAADQGVLLVFGEDIHAAREARKLHTTRLDAFMSDPGPIGEIAEAGPRLVRSVPPLPIIPAALRDDLPLVGVLNAVLDDDGAMAKAMTSNGIAGLVVNGLGGGHVSPATADVLERVAAHIPVVMASRTRGGAVLSKTYGYVGGEIDLNKRGIIRAGWLDVYKARIALLRLLQSGAEHPKIREFFSFFDGG